MPISLTVSTGDSVSLEVTEYENCSDMNGISYKLILAYMSMKNVLKCHHKLGRFNKICQSILLWLYIANFLLFTSSY